MYLNDLAHKNVQKTIEKVRENSTTLDKLVREGKVAIVGALYNVGTAEVAFFSPIEKTPKNHRFSLKNSLRNIFKRK